MRHYTIRNRFYDVRSVSGIVLRPNKVAAGMTYTRQRSRHSDTLNDPDALTLAVRGTLDRLAARSLFSWNAKRTTRTCQCCGQRLTGLVLSDHGRRKLARLRLKYGRVQP